MRYFALIRDSLIVGAGLCPEIDAEAQEVMPGFTVAWLEDEAAYIAVGASPFAFRLVDGAVVPRDAMPAPTVSATTIAADGVAEAVITGLPEPCRVSVRGPANSTTIDVADGEIVLTSTVAGGIEVTVDAPPAYLAWRTIIHAV